MITMLRDVTSESFGGFVGYGGTPQCYHGIEAYDYEDIDEYDEEDPEGTWRDAYDMYVD